VSDLPLFSIIIPVKNAARELKGCLESIRKLGYPQERIEVILVDGLSEDDTIEIGKGFGVKVILNPKQTVAPARNIGFLNSLGEYIAFTDADCIFDRGWLKEALKYFKDYNVAGVSGPTITPKEGTSFNQAIKALYSLANRFCGSVHQEEVRELKIVNDLPGCNAIYRRQYLSKVMPIDENLLTAEDVEMNFRLVRLGYKLLSCPDIIVYHYRRATPKLLWQQMYRFAIGRLEVGKKSIRMIGPAHIIARQHILGLRLHCL